MIVYKITNKINNMQYIGQTRQSLQRRFTAHCRKDSDCTFLSNAIKKYGSDNFIIEVIEENPCPVVVNFKERVFINQYNTLAPNGYNLILSTYRAYELKIKAEPKTSNFKGKKHSEESKIKMRTAKRNFKGNKTSFKKGDVAWSKGLKLGPRKNKAQHE